MRLAASTLAATVSPGMVVSHHASRRKSRPVDTSDPHSGVGGWAP